MGKPPHQIFIVDNDTSVRRALGRLCSSFGFEVKIFASARQCLDEPRIDSTACLIIDVTMPDMDGFKLHTALTTAGLSIPTIFISVHDFVEFEKHAPQSGFVTLLNKPCDEKLLYDAIKKAIAVKSD